MANIQTYWLSGNISERKLVLDNIRNQFSGFENQSFSGHGTYAFLEREISVSSCFSEKRLIIIDALPHATGSARTSMINKFKKLLDNLPPDIVIVFNNLDEKAIFNHVSKIGKVYEFLSVLDQRTANQWVVSKFHEAEKVISEEDADFLVRTSGYDAQLKGIGVDVLLLAIKKICIYVGNRRKNITKDDLVNTVFESQEFIIWRLFEAFDSKDQEKCYSAVEKVKIEHEHLIDAVEQIFNMALWRYKMLFFVKEEYAKHNSKPEVLKAASLLQKLEKVEKTSGWKTRLLPEFIEDDNGKRPKPLYNTFSIEQVINSQYGRKPAMEIYSRKDLYRIIQVLQAGILDIRLRPKAWLMLILDALILSICGQIDDNSLLALRTPYENVFDRKMVEPDA